MQPNTDVFEESAQLISETNKLVERARQLKNKSSENATDDTNTNNGNGSQEDNSGEDTSLVPADIAGISSNYALIGTGILGVAFGLYYLHQRQQNN